MNKSTTVSEGILKSALEIIFLVTGDVPVIYDDFAVFFSREEWKFVEGHKDYKNVVTENRKPSSPFGCAFASNSDRINGKPSDAESRATRRTNETGGEQDDSETPRGRIPASEQEDEQIRETTQTQTSAGGREAATECSKCRRVRRDSHAWECCQIHCHDLSRGKDAKKKSSTTFPPGWKMDIGSNKPDDEQKRRAQTYSSDQPLENGTSTAHGPQGELCTEACAWDRTAAGDRSRGGQIKGELLSTDHLHSDGAPTMHNHGKASLEACTFNQPEDFDKSSFHGDPNTPKHSLDSSATEKLQGIKADPDAQTFMSGHTVQGNTGSPSDFKVELLRSSSSLDREVHGDALYKAKVDDRSEIQSFNWAIQNDPPMLCRSRVGPNMSPPSSDARVQGDTSIFCKFPLEPYTWTSSLDGRAPSDTGSPCKVNVPPCSSSQPVGNGKRPSLVCKEPSRSHAWPKLEEDAFVFSRHHSEDTNEHSPVMSTQSKPEIHKINANFTHDHCYINCGTEEVREEASAGLFNQRTFYPDWTPRTPHVCPLCAKRFTYKSVLLRHQKTHTGEKSFICNECGKRYVCKFNLVVHQRKHTGEKPYQCKICSKHFAHKSAFNQHMKRHGKIIKP
uniref:C2H2-type domain-containing protein n=1 Tax=Leptobrachium leishanense TaxID=445787 RepID=A0A8C5WBW4_9ANUR